MVNEGIVLGHKISERGIEVDKAKVDAIEKMPCPKDIKGIRSFLGHAGFYRRFIKDFSKISRPLTIFYKRMFLLFLMMIEWKPLKHMLIDVFLSVYAMHLLPFKDV